MVYGDAVQGLQSRLRQAQEALEPRKKFSFNKSSGADAGSGSGSGLGGFTAKKNASAISIGDAVKLAREKGTGGKGAEGSASASGEGGGRGRGSLDTTPAEVVDLTQASSEQAAEGEVKEDSDRPPPQQQQRHGSLPSNPSINLSDHEATHMIIPSSQTRSTTAGNLSNFHNCVVDMSRSNSATGNPCQPFAALALKNMKGCLVICGRVNGAAHLTNMTNCIIVVSSRQFRLHDSKNCDIYLSTSSRPIMENSSEIRFAPLPEIYSTGGDGAGDEQWDQVDDFNWHRSEASPNWSFLPKERWVREEVWRDVVPGKPGKGVEDILGAVGLK